VTFQRLNHVGITVGDLEGTLAFFHDLFGIEPVVRGTGEGVEVGKSVGLGDVRIRYAFLDLRNTRLELLQYELPPGRPAAGLRNCDTGAVHLSFDVDDVEATYLDLRARGFEFLSEPIRLDASHGALEGLVYVYVQGPDGLVVQLYEMPETSRA
jgi:catechol 2,3-dioxygenase-like lactoylglutathione lyase family enzyme